VRSRLKSAKEIDMPILYVIGGVIAVALLVYLFVAMLKPESFS
jgi:K+-transporting ATPase KdpF subunit